MINNFLTPNEISNLVEDIRQAEFHSTGEIRIHIDKHSEDNFAENALKIFHKLGMQNTKERSGVLFYVNFEHRYLTIIGDEGIHKKVKQKFWNQLHDEITEGFVQEKYYVALKDAISKTGTELKKYFPVEGTNKNELHDEISFS